MSDFPWLTTLILLPLVGGIVTAYLPSRGLIARQVGLGFALHDQLAQAALLAQRLGGWAVVIAGAAFAIYLAIKVIRRQLFLRELRIKRQIY